MLLAIDMGNTTVSLAVMRFDKIVQTFEVLTRQKEASFHREFIKILSRIKQKYPKLKSAIICSVVPDKLSIVINSLSRKLNIEPFVIGKDLRVPIKNNYRDPNQVGQDRLVGAFAATLQYGSPLIIIDFGTAITFDVVSGKGAYEGGVIVPGIQLSAESLFQKTALLPRLDKIRKPKRLVGKSTEESILSGLFYGYGSLCDGMIAKLREQLGMKTKVILTGGYTEAVSQYIVQPIFRIDPVLVFKGMAYIYNMGVISKKSDRLLKKS